MKKVLLLDDDPDLRALLGAALNAEGLQVLEAAKGTRADQILAQTACDLLVVDGLLPDCSGIQFIERIRKRDQITPIVFISAFFRDLKVYRHLTTELGVALVLHKPIEPNSFAEKIYALVEPGAVPVVDVAEIDDTAIPADEAVPADLATPADMPPAETEIPAPVAGVGMRPVGSVSPVTLKLEQLSRAFGRKLPEKVTEIERLLFDTMRDPPRLDEARLAAHRLRGSAGSFGYAEVGVAMGVVEDALVQEIESGTMQRDFWEALDQALQQARKAAAQVPEVGVLTPGPNGASRPALGLGTTISTPGPVRRQRPSTYGSATMKVLFVDDEEDIRKIAQFSLETVGRFRLLTASSGEEAIELARKAHPDLIMLDILMPGMDGFAAQLELKKDPELAGIPVIFMTAMLQRSEVGRLLSAGALGLIQKPFDPMALPAEINRVLAAHGLGE